MPGAADPPNLRECREDFFRLVLPLTPNGQAASRGLLPDDAESRDRRVPQKIDVRRVARVALRPERVRMREQPLAGLPSLDFVAVLHDRRVDLVDRFRRGWRTLSTNVWCLHSYASTKSAWPRNLRTSLSSFA